MIVLCLGLVVFCAACPIPEGTFEDGGADSGVDGGDSGDDGGGDGSTNPCEALGLADRDGDGISDQEEGDGADDTDSDGIPDSSDPDSDGDTVPDALESGLTNCEGTPRDTDGDGTPDYRDDDSDGDSWLDEEEAGVAPGEQPLDTDGDGAPDLRDTDSDGDNLDDVAEREHGTSRTEQDTDGDGFTDYQEVSQDTDPLDENDFPGEDPCNPTDCQPEELCGELGSGDGLDNDCDGEVDEICPCTPGETRPCFAGPPSVRGQGACTDGLETCDEFGGWSSCAGGVFPQPEICDGADNDCDGLFDEELDGCENPLSCPATETATPLSTLELDGGRIYDGPHDSWTWEVFCPPTVDTCPEPDDPSARNTSIYIISSGAYRVRATIVIDGETFTCEYTVEVGGNGLRVELTWDTQGHLRGNTDVDLHLHQTGTTTNFFTEDDCYFADCKASSYSIDWGLEPTTDLSACENAPQGEGAIWADTHGACFNPRLDVDVIRCDPAVGNASAFNFCAPENINVDNPEIGAPYRIMVNFYYNNGYNEEPTYPTVNIYCGGALRATLGEGEVVLDTGGNLFAPQNNDNWLVADVVFSSDECDHIDCEIQPLLDDAGAPLIQNGPAFGPPWSF